VCNARLKTAAQRKRSASAGKGKAAAAPAPANAARKKRRLNPRGTGAHHRGGEEAVGGGEEGQSCGEIGRAGKTTPAAAKPGLRRAAQRGGAKKSTPAVAPRKVAGRTKAAGKAAGRG